MHLDLWTIALQTINFVILAALLYRFLYRPVLGMIEARQAEVRRQYDDAKAMEDKARANLEAIASAREGIAAEREAALKAAGCAGARGGGGAARGRPSPGASASRRHPQYLAAERERALDEARRAALDLGAEFARRLLSGMPEQLRGEAWIERVETQLNALAKPERESLAKQLENGHALTVRTAAPLPSSVADTWKSRLRRSLGDSVAISFEVNPELIAGVELHFPDAVLRLSWQSELASLRSEIEAHGNAH